MRKFGELQEILEWCFSLSSKYLLSGSGGGLAMLHQNVS